MRHLGEIQVKFNGTLLDSFAPSRGLRQGDPLSPFMFLLVAGGLSALLKDGEEKGAYTPLEICRRAPGVSHLLFADDTLLFFKAEEEQAKKVQEVLNMYERVTGQCSNPDKCSALFVHHVSWTYMIVFRLSFTLVSARLRKST